MSTLQVAQTILEQLGGGMFRVMTGSRDFVGSDDALSFKVGRNDMHVTHVRIVLTPMDTYTVTFSKVRAGKVSTLAEYEDVYADNLRAIFTKGTGLVTSLGSMR